MGEIYINTETTTTNIEKTVYTVMEIRKILRIGKNQAYALVKRDDFPAKRIGNDYRIPKKAFEWYNHCRIIRFLKNFVSFISILK